MHAKYVIIGASAAGLGAAYRLRLLDASASIICLSAEFEIPYNKCFIVDYLSGLRERDTVLTLTSEVAAAKNITCLLGMRAIAIDVALRRVYCEDGTTINYEAVCIATGCSPIIPQVSGSDSNLRGLFSFYHLSDVDAIYAYIKNNAATAAVVVGGGLTGLEAADGLKIRGLDVTVVERNTHVLYRFVDESGARLIEQYMRKNNIKICLNQTVSKIEHQNNMITAVVLDSGQRIKADLLIYAVGTQPNSDLASAVGLAMHNGYIVVDNRMRTSRTGIYAAGDCSVQPEQKEPTFTWPEAMQQGMVAAYSMVGAELKQYSNRPAVVSSAFFGIKFAASGVVNPQHLEEYVLKTQMGDDYYHRYLYKNDLLKGFILVGNTQILSQLRRTVV